MATAPLPIPPGMQNNFGRNGSHWGLDIPPSPATSPPNQEDVRAPETGVIIDVWQADQATALSTDNTKAPARRRGYGPNGLMIRGDSGAIHLLAHLAAWNVPPKVGDRVDEGEQVGLIARGVQVGRYWFSPHVHWEVRQSVQGTNTAEPDKPNLDPVAWLAGKVKPFGGDLTTLVLIGLALHFWSKRGFR